MKPGSKPLENGVSELRQALEYPKIKSAPVSDLQAILRRCMLLVGIRAANIPNAEETAVLLQFIYKKFAGLTLAEIQLAFEKAVAGELDCDAKCYENFSPEYFGRIMTAYKEWASRKWDENQMYNVKPEQKQISMQADWKELCELYYQDYLKGEFKINIMPYQLYDEFVRCEMMAADVYEDWESTAQVMLCKKLNEEKLEARNELEKYHLEMSIAKILAGENKIKVTEFAKKLAVELLYKTAKEKNYKQLFQKQ